MLSVVILSRDHADLTCNALRALTRAHFDGEVILVDQASSDGTATAASRLLHGQLPLQVVANPANEPYAVAANRAASRATGEALLFLDNDTELEPGAIAALLAALEQDPQHVAVGPRLLYPTGHIQEAGLALPLWLVPLRLGTNARGDDHRYGCPRTAFALSTSCLLVRRAAFERVGGFDQGYHWGFEGADLAMALRRDRGKVFYEPRARCVHLGGATLDRHPELAQTDRNRNRFLERWGPDLFRRVAAYLDRLAESGPPRFLIYGTGDAGRHLANTLEVGGYEVAGFLTSNGVRSVGPYPAYRLDQLPADVAGRVLIGSPYVREAEEELARAGLLAGAALPVLVD
jgi:GT2 family glycosyltransferase